MRRTLFTCFCLACICMSCLNAQPRSRRSDVTVTALGTVGAASVRIRRDPASGIFYILQNDGNILRIAFRLDGSVGDSIVYRQSDHGLNHPLGLAFGKDGTMYLVGNDSTGQLGTATVVKGVPDLPGSLHRTWNVIAKTVLYPYGHVYNHRMSGIIVSRAGDSLYVNSGAATDHGELREGNREVGLTSIILKLPVNGQNITLENDREWLRSNGYLLAAWGGGSLYTTFSNDTTYPPPPNNVTFTEPVASSGPDADRYRDTATGAVKDASNLGQQLSTFTPHRSPDGIVFDGDSLLAGDLKGGAFVTCLATSVMLQALGDTSQDLVHCDLNRTGDGYTAHITRLVSGFNSPIGIELEGSTLYVLETGLEGTNSSPKLWKVSLPADVRTDVTAGNTLPNSFTLLQNYPNPFNPSTNIDFSTPDAGIVTLVVYDVLGQQVQILMNRIVPAGNHSVQWDGRDSRGMPVGSGVYFYRLAAGLHHASTKKMIVMR